MDPAPDQAPRSSRRFALLIALGLVVLTLAAYLPALDNGFVDYDDGQYVTANPRVREGLTAAGLRWALTAEVAGNWHPLTLVSHMLDGQLFGLQPRGHHLTSVVLHLANVLLLFAVLARMTGARWRSALVAALFAVHPTHVESVAWVAERKDVLCALFWLAGMGAYLRYARRPSAGRYLPVAGCHALALAAKPMAVTFPLALLLLDFWPLGRLRPGVGGRGAASLRSALPRVAEKLPLLALSLADGIVTLAAQEATVSPLARLSLGTRLANAAVAVAAYLGKTLLPRDLAVFYPLRSDLSAAQVAGAAALVAALTAGAVAARRRAPYLTVGWFWFLLTLAPVSGLVQVGAQAMADRYTYLPSIGLYVAVAWGAAALVAGRPLRRRRRAAVAAAAALAVAAVVALVPATRAQIGTWADTETLFRHALSATRDNYLAHLDLAYALEKRGAGEEALEHFRAARAIVPRSVEANAALGTALAARGRPAEGLPYLKAAAAADPRDPQVRVDLAATLDDLGDRVGAIAELRAALALDPGLARAHHGLGLLLLAEGRRVEAEVELRAAVALDPGLGPELAPVLAGLTAE